MTIDLLTMFVKSPGDFLYFLLVMLFAVVGVVMAANLRVLPSLYDVSRRFLLGMGTVLATWGVFVLASLFTVVTRQEPLLILPPIERLVDIIVVVLIGWVFVTSDLVNRRRDANMIVLGIIGAAFVGYLLTALDWTGVYYSGMTDFNLRFNTIWALALAIVCVFGIVALGVFFRQISDAPMKIVFFGLVLSGSIYQILGSPFIGSYPGAIRLALMVALAIPLYVLYRLQTDQLAQLRDRTRELMVRTEAQQLRQTTTRPVADTQSSVLMRTLGKILETATAASLPQQIVNTTLDTVRVDIGFILRVQDANYADIVYAYDKFQQRSPNAMSLNLNNQPTLLNVIERRVARTLYVDRNRDELDDLFTRLDIDRIGTVYFYPLVRGNELKAVMGFGLPYTERELDDTSEELLKSITILASSLISLSDEATETRILAEDRAIQAMVEGVPLSQVPNDAAIFARQEIQQSLQVAREQIAQLSKQVVQLTVQLDDERGKLADILEDSQPMVSVSQTLVAITEEQQRLRDERDKLAQRVQEAETTLGGATATSNQAVVDQMVASLEREKQKLLRERDRLQTQLTEMQMQGNLMLPEYIQQIMGRMQTEQTQLEQEKSQLSDQLNVMQAQLHGMGIATDDVGGSSAPLIGQLYEERASLLEKLDTLQRDRELLLSERTRLTDSINRSRETDARLVQLQSDLENIAQDREAALKQRDKLRTEFEDLKQKLDVVKEHRARLLAQVSGYELELNESREEQGKMRLEIQELADARSDLLHLRDKLLVEKQSLQVEFDETVAFSEGDTQRIERINQDSMSRLESMVNDLSLSRNKLEHELNDARLRLAKSDADREQLAANVSTALASTMSYQTNNPDLFVGLVQELRTPLTSLIGYVDLLLGESAGILGEMQRKFLQRVSTNITRMQTMIEDLVHVAQLDAGNYKLEPMPVNLVTLIEDAITGASIQFREKAMTVSLDLDDHLPLLPADKDSLAQIVGQLLTNAYLVSAPNSEIIVMAKRQTMQLMPNTAAVDTVMMSVEDRGGGIQPEDIPRVFARKYKAENPLIQGLGDTGVGMSIAKTLTEAHGGRLWVETRSTVGSIFSVALPLVRNEGIEHAS